MYAKVLILAVFAVIVISLGRALFTLIQDKGRSERTVRALTVRIALSVGLFALLMLGYATGILQPHGIYAAGHQVTLQAPAPAD